MRLPTITTHNFSDEFARMRNSESFTHEMAAPSNPAYAKCDDLTQHPSAGSESALRLYDQCVAREWMKLPAPSADEAIYWTASLRLDVGVAEIEAFCGRNAVAELIQTSIASELRSKHYFGVSIDPAALAQMRGKVRKDLADRRLLVDCVTISPIGVSVSQFASNVAQLDAKMAASDQSFGYLSPEKSSDSIEHAAQPSR